MNGFAKPKLITESRDTIARLVKCLFKGVARGTRLKKQQARGGRRRINAASSGHKVLRAWSIADAIERGDEISSKEQRWLRDYLRTHDRDPRIRLLRMRYARGRGKRGPGRSNNKALLSPEARRLLLAREVYKKVHLDGKPVFRAVMEISRQYHVSRDTVRHAHEAYRSDPCLRRDLLIELKRDYLDNPNRWTPNALAALADSHVLQLP